MNAGRQAPAFLSRRDKGPPLSQGSDGGPPRSPAVQSPLTSDSSALPFGAQLLVLPPEMPGELVQMTSALTLPSEGGGADLTWNSCGENCLNLSLLRPGPWVPPELVRMQTLRPLPRLGGQNSLPGVCLGSSKLWCNPSRSLSQVHGGETPGARRWSVGCPRHFILFYFITSNEQPQ